MPDLVAMQTPNCPQGRLRPPKLKHFPRQIDFHVGSAVPRRTAMSDTMKNQDLSNATSTTDEAERERIRQRMVHDLETYLSETLRNRPSLRTRIPLIGLSRRMSKAS
jgi:hypothetical protein